MNMTDIYKTSDLPLTSYLIMKGADLMTISKTEELKPKAVFHLNVANLNVKDLTDGFTGSYEEKLLQTEKALKQKVYRVISTH